MGSKSKDQISVPLPHDLRAAIERAAQAEHRTIGGAGSAFLRVGAR